MAGTAEKYLKPEVIRQVARLDLRAKFIVEGFISGLHASPFQGFSVEFSEHRKYTAGDNISDIDWNVYAKTDRFYIKKFQAETNLTGYMVMDLSGSMGYTYRQELTKFEYGISLAAALCLPDDPPAGPGGPDRVRSEGPPEPGARQQAVAARQHPVAAGQAQAGGNDAHRGQPAPGRQHDPAPQPGDALHRPAGRPRDDLEGHSPLRFAGHDLIIFHILDEAEAVFPFEGMLGWKTTRPTRRSRSTPRRSRPTISRRSRSFARIYKDDCVRARIDYVPLHTGMPFDKALMSYLLTRQARA